MAHTKWFLHTGDAHDLYRRFGFAEPGPSARALEAAELGASFRHDTRRHR